MYSGCMEHSFTHWIHFTILEGMNPPWGITAEETHEVFMPMTKKLPQGLTGYRLTLRDAVTG